MRTRTEPDSMKKRVRTRRTREEMIRLIHDARQKARERRSEDEKGSDQAPDQGKPPFGK